MYYALILETSRKAKAARNIYDYLHKNSHKRGLLPEQKVEGYLIKDGIIVPQQDKHRILNLRLFDEHLSPYFKTNMNLFILIMLDDQVGMQVFKADHGWMFLFDNVQYLPKPFGTQGYDMR
ncbi:hypothetical protein [Effusibacillus lacus]|uniref:Uncharacterized protein n=1 Tax=Effusibacillus lacus TaxID=1348429 RepID=A0A292YPE6_9BACL|nr:hypothetical protein [Effusibacillus lacus]TCS76271.1 hypothetical protein EDD64_10335 [Effusibacillus lacus]GAX91818.1 hypothetical protein EFBL_3509 [Effusibacillus lacus]